MSFVSELHLGEDGLDGIEVGGVPKTPPIEMNERNVAEIYCVSEKIIIVEYTAI